MILNNPKKKVTISYVSYLWGGKTLVKCDNCKGEFEIKNMEEEDRDGDFPFVCPHCKTIVYYLKNWEW